MVQVCRFLSRVSSLIDYPVLNLRKGGNMIRSHRMPIPTPDSGVVTSVALDTEWIVVGLANSKIHLFSAITGVLSRTLMGHELGVWAVHLVCRGGYWGRGEMDEDGYPDDADDPVVPAALKTALGIDRRRRMQYPPSVGGDSSKPSDICCTSEGWGQPNSIIVSASCDKTLRVWDAKSGYVPAFVWLRLWAYGRLDTVSMSFAGIPPLSDVPEYCTTARSQ
jgi:F-box and WD-40 domain protein CDC4